MRIAMVDLSTYAIGGDKVWDATVAWGLEQLKHEVDRISATGASFQALRGYDLVIFSDVYANHRAAGVDLLDLLLRLRHASVPTVLGLHGNLGQVRGDERKREAINCLKATEFPWVTRRTMIAGYEDVLPMSRLKVMEVIPYRPRYLGAWPDYDPVAWERRRGFLITGRIAQPKGQRVLAALADRLEAPVTIAGKAQFSSARQIREDLLVNGGSLVSQDGAGWAAGWEIKTPGGNLVRYTGGYQGPDEVPWDLATVHVNLTAAECTGGHLEYTSLEAVDAGLFAAVPRHVPHLYSRSVIHLLTEGYQTWRDLKRERRETIEITLGTLNEMVGAYPPSVDDARRLFERHDPVTYAALLLSDRVPHRRLDW